MSSNVVRITDRAQNAAPRVEDYLGPAHVVSVASASGAGVEVAIPGLTSPVNAALALAFPYAPNQGDTLLVIGRSDAYYVIGVLHGSGSTTLSLPGDVALHAGGALHLSAGKEITMSGPEVEIQTSKLRMIAGAVVQSFTSAFQRVKELLSVHAGESHTLVEGATHTQAKSATILTEGTTTINGKEIHLG